MTGIHAGLLGSQGSRLTATAQNIIESLVSGPAEAGYRLRSTGVAQSYTGGGGYVDITGEWVIPTDFASLYECRVTVTSGSLSSGTSGSWLALTSDRVWTRSRISSGTSECTFTVEIGYAGLNSALISYSVTLTADVII